MSEFRENEETNSDSRSESWPSLAWVVPPPSTVTVSNRIVPFLVGDTYKPSFATITGRGDNPTYG